MSERTADQRVTGISAVVCNYNGANYLAACLDAIGALEDGPSEVIVVDNASTDGSLELVRSRYPEVRIIETGFNAGPAYARNVGMRAASEPWVLAIDNDAIVAPDLLNKLRAAAEADATAVIVQPRSVFRNEPTRVHYDGGFLHYAGLIALRNWYRELEAAAGEGVVAVDVAVSVCLLVERDTILAAGGYDESYFILFEDLDLSFRMRTAGRAILSVEDAIVQHDAGTPGVSFRQGTDYPASRVFYHSRNRWLYMLKCYRWRTLALAAPGLALYELVWFAFALKQGGLFAWVRGKVAVCTQVGELFRKRRSVQSARTLNDRDLLVGGPLTVTPGLRASTFAGPLLAALDGLMAFVWKVVRPFTG